jgi:hypothetical protein
LSDIQRIKRRIPRIVLPLSGGLILVIVLASAPVPTQATSDLPNEHAVSHIDGESLSTDSLDRWSDVGSIHPTESVTYYVFLPFFAKPKTCGPITGESYGTLSVNPPPTDRPAEDHADLNLALRGYEPTDKYKGLIYIPGGTDPGAPQLPGLFADNRTGTFSTVYQIYKWEWDCNCRGALETIPEVTLAGLVVAPDETIHVPESGYTIGSGYEVLVLYASKERITLKYTRNDNVVSGYTLHVENVCVEPTLLALYQAWNDAGRSQLPALQAGQAFGRALDDEIGVVIRDNGTSMDPRSQKDWWR